MKGLSRQFAFAQFGDVAAAKAFLEKHHPSLQFKGSFGDSNSDDGIARARISYSREKEDRERPGKGEGDWICEVVCTRT